MDKVILDHQPIIWDPVEYSRLSYAQDKASKELIMHLIPLKSERIIDVGCGDGKITARLSQIVPEGNVLGIDLSSEMISHANKNHSCERFPNLSFQVENALKINSLGSFDVVFSSFALQWVKNKNLFFQNAYKCLSKTGKLAVTVPMQASYELEHALKHVVVGKWGHHFQDFEIPWHFSTDMEYSQLINQNSFEIVDYYRYDEVVTFASKGELVNYISIWLPHLGRLSSPPEKELFLKEVMQIYFKMVPLNRDGSTSLKFPISSFIARPN